MCGIAGILHRTGQPASAPDLRRMADAIRHRGPDGEGFFIDDNVGLAHRRLAIIDLSAAAHQPISNENGDIVLTYNGEIYNFRELRRELEALGHKFRSRTDSEVVVHAYEQWGLKAIERFNGMFAFAIWDRPRRRLVLARDRYGIKPLYYGWFGSTFLFASEIKGILAHAAARAELDVEGLFEYLTFQNLFTNRTLFKDIRILPAGCTVTLHPKNAEAPASRYWDYSFEEPDQNGVDGAEYVEELDRLFKQSVRRQLVSDVPVGSYLSGGMDSGSITALAAREVPYLNTFTCGFDLRSASGLELGFDEREKAEYMSYLFKTEHYEMVLKPGDMERVLPSLAWHLEEPRVGQSYPNFYAAKLASRFVKVCLSGAGGDELFGGYPWRYYRAVLNSGFENYVDKYYSYWQRLLDGETIRKVFEPVWGDVAHVSTRDIFRGVFAQHGTSLTRPEDYVNHSLYFEAKTFLHGLLVVEDKLSMAHSLETRVPFLDNDLVDFAMRVPVRLKLGNLDNVMRVDENELSRYFYNTQDGKLILRNVMERYIPDTVTRGEKRGFSAPDASWFRGESLDYVRATLLDPTAHIYSYLNFECVSVLIHQHLAGACNRRLFIWSLLNLEWLLKSYFGGDAVSQGFHSQSLYVSA